jgi:hypothetical protein
MAVKVDTQEKSSLYNGGKKRPLRHGGLILHLLLVLACLLAVHFLNLFLQWSVISHELAQKPSYNSPEYSFIGFSPFHKQEIEAVYRLPNAAPTGRVFAFFDLLHFAVFMVWNNGSTGEFFDLGPVLAALPAGVSRVTFFPASVFLLSQEGETVSKNYGGSILGHAWGAFLDKKTTAGRKGVEPMPGSFIAKQPEESRYLKIPYLAYFYLPLVAIILLVATSGIAMSAAFFYYAGMFFLFDYQKLFVSIPFAWAFKALDIELPAPRILAVLAASIAVFFLGCSVFGLFRWKNREMPPSSKWIVLFFVLLPFFLFF